MQDQLTPREHEVAALVAQGQSNRAIARALTVEVKTVEAHVTRIHAKLGTASRVQIATRIVRRNQGHSTGEPEDNVN